MAVSLLTGIALALAAGGAAVSATGQIKSGNAARRAAESEAEREEFNAGLAEEQAADAIARGAEDEARFRLQVRGLVGVQRAGFAGQNVDVTVGSPADVQRDAQQLGELDALLIRRNAAREAWGFEMEAKDRRMGADVARRGGRAAQTASRYGAAGTLLGTGSSLLLERYGWRDRRASEVPRVEAYGGRKVRTAPKPGVRRQTAETYASQGGPIGEAMGAAGAAALRLGAGLHQDIRRREQDRADQVVSLTTLRQLNDLDTQILTAPDSGLLHKRGLAAMQERDAAIARFDEQSGMIEATLTTERQRLFFEQQRLGRRARLVEAIDRHAMGQLREHDTNEFNGFLESSEQRGIANASNPRLVSEVLAEQTAAIRDYAKRNQLGPEVTEGMVTAARSNILVGVIERQLAVGNEAAAKVYFEETKDQIAGDKLAAIEKALEEGTLRGASQRKADEILGAGGTLTEQRERVRAIDDPKLRDAVLQRVEHEAAIRDRQELEQLEVDGRQAYDLVDKRGSVQAIPPALWARLPGGTRSALRSYAEHLADGSKPKTDLVTYYALMQQAAADPDTFTKQNLLNYRHKLDETEFKQLTGLQLAVRTGDRKQAEKELDDFRTERDVVNDALTRAGIDPSPKDTDKAGLTQLARFRSLVAGEVRRVQDVTKKKATNEDLEAIANRILARQIVDEGYFTTSTKSLVTASIDDVPAADRAQIQESLRRYGLAVSDETILQVWLEAQLRK